MRMLQAKPASAGIDGAKLRPDAGADAHGVQLSGCNCSKPATSGSASAGSASFAGQTQSFTLSLDNGTTQEFSGSLLEAQAQLVRSGGGTLYPKR